MSHTRLLVVATIIAGIILAGFALSVPHTRDVVETSLPLAPESQPSVALRDSFKKGLHTITGAIEAPNPCTTLSADAVPVGASSTEGILVEISLPTDAGICLKRPVTMRFSTTIAAPASLPIIATVNGVAATTTDL